MSYVGMLCFGLFVGSMITLALNMLPSNFGAVWKAVVAILGAVSSGAVFNFIKFLLDTGAPKDSVYAYPIGLFITIIWYMGQYAIIWIQSPDATRNFLGWLGLVGIIAVTTLLADYVVTREGALGPQVSTILTVILIVISSVIALMLYIAVSVQLKAGKPV